MIHEEVVTLEEALKCTEVSMLALDSSMVHEVLNAVRKDPILNLRNFEDSLKNVNSKYLDISTIIL